MLFCWIFLGLQTLMIEGRNDSKIQNGTIVAIDEYPFVGCLMRRRELVNFPKCTTSLVTTIWAMTAAHCITYNATECLPLRMRDFVAENLFVVMGTANLLSFGPNSQQRAIISGSIHPQFTYSGELPFRTRYDVGAVKFDSPFSLTKFVGLVPFFPPGVDWYSAIERMMRPGYEHAKIIGWGATRLIPRTATRPPGELPYSPIPLFGQFDLVTHDVCCKNYSYFVRLCLAKIEYSGFDCVIPYGPNTSTVAGDSGASVIARYNRTAFDTIDVVVGVYSGGFTFRRSEGVVVLQPALLTKYGIVKEFIDHVIAGRVPHNRELPTSGACCSETYQHFGFFLFYYVSQLLII